MAGYVDRAAPALGPPWTAAGGPGQARVRRYARSPDLGFADLLRLLSRRLEGGLAHDRGGRFGPTSAPGRDQHQHATERHAAHLGQAAWRSGSLRTSCARTMSRCRALPFGWHVVSVRTASFVGSITDQSRGVVTQGSFDTL